MKSVTFDKTEAAFLKGLLLLNGTKHALKISRKIENAEKRITVASAKAKGRNFQMWVCARIAALFGVKFEQNDDDCPIHSREMGQNGADIVLRGEVKRRFPFTVECKACETVNLSAFVEQAKHNCEDGKWWLLLLKKKSLKGEVAVMPFEAFERLVGAYLDVEKNSGD